MAALGLTELDILLKPVDLETILSRVRAMACGAMYGPAARMGPPGPQAIDSLEEVADAIQKSMILLRAYRGGAMRPFSCSIVVLSLFFLAFPAQAAGYRIGVLYWSMSIPGQVAMRQGLEDEAARINDAARAGGRPEVRLEARVAGDGERGIENQIRQMHELIAAKVDAIIVQPTDNAALGEPLLAANRAAIPVVAYDQYVSRGELAAFRTSDNYQAGYLGGEYMAARFRDKAEMRLVLVEYPHVSSTVERVNGFLDALTEQNRPYRLLKSYSAVEPVGGRKAAADILRDFPRPGDVDVIFTVNDGGGLEVVRGLAEAGRTEIQVATVDGDPASVENIKAGRLTVIDSAQFCGPLGAEAMRAAYAVLTGQRPPRHALVPVFPITAETLAMYPGWMGPIPDPFAKPWSSKSPQWQNALRAIKQ
jgi:ribose transport system substrate-binding protein